jgi:hypothetical protein
MSFTVREWHIALEKSLKCLPKGTWAFSGAGGVLRVLGKDGVMRTYKAPSTFAVAEDQAREIKKHKQWASLAMLGASLCIADSPIPIHITVHPKRTGPAPDRDKIVAAAKSYLDGIAAYLCVDDRHFSAPTVSISDERTGQFTITVGETE